MKEYNLITIYYDRTTHPKDKSMEIDEYVGTIILEILERKGITENDEMLIDLTDTFLRDKIKECYKDMSPMPDFAHEQAITLYKQYLCVGGMPEAVNNFIENELKKGMF